MPFQLSFLDESEGYRPIDLPRLEVVQKHPLGEIRHLIRDASSQTIIRADEIRVSPRKKLKLYELASGEKILVTKKHKLSRPEAADGVLQQKKGSGYRWLSHKSLENLESQIEEKGWKDIRNHCIAQ